MNRLSGKVAIVTGGAGGIGSATVERFVQEGARVVVADIELDKAKEVAARCGEGAVAVHLDAADERSVQTVVDDTARRFGRIDILHNNHAWILGLVRGDETVVDTEFEVWDKAMSINLRSYFAGCKYVVPHMIRGGGGSIINMASDSGIVANFDHIAYNTSKAGVMALTTNVATQHGMDGVRCNAISPGLIVTPYVKKAAPELVALVARHNLVRHTGEPSDIAALAAFLASEDSRFITGQIICCDGGLLAHLPQNADHLDYIRRGGESKKSA
jgi:NAD(P)-dependent dehydrogenase (short-subunit alcohol dehydrogenase family)